MKKIVLVLIMMFSLILVNAEEESVNVKLEWVPNVYYNYEKNGVSYWGQFAYIHAGNRIAYCLDISQTINSDIYTKSDEIQDNNLVILAGYFGYNYDGNNSLKDYMATQKLIWFYLGIDVYFTTESHGNGQKINIESNLDRIIYKINNHAYFPAYDTDYNFKIGIKYDLMQSNTKLNEYNIINNTKNLINFNENGITFNANEAGKNYFYLETKYPFNFDNEIYIAENSQKIMVIGSMNNLKRKYNYDVLGGTLNVNVVLNARDKEENNNISDNTFALYFENELIGLYGPSSIGEFSVHDLNIGKYTLKHIETNEAFLLEKEEYNFEIQADDLIENITIELDVKKMDITIKKSYGNPLTNTIYYDEGVVYKIFDKDNNVIFEQITNKEGVINITLEYGSYKIVQSTVSGINIFHEDIVIDKNDCKDEIIYEIYDNYFDSKIKFMVIDKEDNKLLTNVSFSINDIQYTIDNKEYFISEAVPYGTYLFSNIEIQDYNNIEDFEFKLNENSNFYVCGKDSCVDVVLYAEKNKNILLPKEDNDYIEQPKEEEIEKEEEEPKEEEIEKEEEQPKEEEIEKEEEQPKEEEIEKEEEQPKEEEIEKEEEQPKEEEIEKEEEQPKEEEIEKEEEQPKEEEIEKEEEQPKEEEIEKEEENPKEVMENEEDIKKENADDIQKLPFLGVYSKNEKNCKNIIFDIYNILFFWL